MFSAYPKIFALGSPQTERIFQGEIEITEKLDGSQIAFGKVDGEVLIRSKGAQIFPEAVQKMFRNAVIQILDPIRQDLYEEGTVYYGEYLDRNKHNVLCYERIPRDHIAIFGVKKANGKFLNYSAMDYEAKRIGFDVVPLLPSVEAASFDQLLERESYLGGVKIEGFVIKNYSQEFLLGNQVIPFMAGKYVSEAFKEIHKKNWKAENTGKGRWETYKDQFNTEPRFRKAVQHLRDAGLLTQTPKDIGSIIREVHKDIELEEKVNIQDFLWNEFGSELLRSSTRGIAEWYKKELAHNAFSDIANESQKLGLYDGQERKAEE